MAKHLVSIPVAMVALALAGCSGAGTTIGPGSAPGGVATSPATNGPGTGATSAPGSKPTASPTPAGSPVAVNADGIPVMHHIFLIILENQAEDNTFGSKMPVPYLSQNAAGQGALLENYYATSHASLGNYVSLFSGQSVTQLNQEDCPTYTQILNGVSDSYGQIAGAGCVYPSNVMTFADQMGSAKYTIKGYMQDMGNDTDREAATCGQTQPTATTGVYGSGDLTQEAQAGNALEATDQYAMRHNPWPYFMSVVGSGACASEVRPLNQSTLPVDLGSIATTANFTWITPNLCNDGHDVPCAAPGANGDTNSTYDNENAFLMQWIPIITRSPAFLQDGLLMVTFDESDPAKNTSVGTDTTMDATSCCQEKLEVDPNTTTPGDPPGDSYADGSGGGRTGTVLISPFIAPGTVSAVEYNHYNTLRTLEDEFGLGHLGFAGYPDTITFGTEIFGTTPTRHTIAL